MIIKAVYHGNQFLFNFTTKLFKMFTGLKLNNSDYRYNQ